MNKIKKIICIIFVLLIALPVFIKEYSNQKIIIHHSFTLKMNDMDNHKEYSYTISPVPSKTMECGISAKFQNGNECDEVLRYDIDCEKMTFTLACLQEFEEPIEVMIYLVNDSAINCKIQVEYEKKITSLISLADDMMIDIFEDENGNADYILFHHPISDDYFYKPQYSKYTIDKEYEFKVQFDEITIVDECLPQFPQEYALDEVGEAILELITIYLNDKRIMDEQLIYDILQKHHLNNPHILEFLKECVVDESWILIEANYDVFCENQSIYSGQFKIEIEFTSLNF